MTAVFLSPHNDDETLFGAFTLLREQPLVVVCLRSHAQLPFGITSETREAETDAAMSVLGISEWRQWPIPDTDAEEEVVESFMWGLLEGADPDIVYAPAVESDGNKQHNLIGRLADVVFGSSVRRYLTYTGTPGRRSTWGSEVSYERSWPKLKREALDCYQSQIEHFARNGSLHFADADQREWYA